MSYGGGGGGGRGLRPFIGQSAERELVLYGALFLIVNNSFPINIIGLCWWIHQESQCCNLKWIYQRGNYCYLKCSLNLPKVGGWGLWCAILITQMFFSLEIKGGFKRGVIICNSKYDRNNMCTFPFVNSWSCVSLLFTTRKQHISFTNLF